MALLSSSSPSVRQRVLGKRRNSSVFTILLLLLSHSVWNTLQCGTSSSQPKNRPSSVEDGNGYDNGSSSDESLVNVGNGGSTAFTNSKSVEKKLEQEKVRVCKDRLLDMIREICGDNNFFTPIIEDTPSPARESSSLSELLERVSKRSSVEMLQRRITRSLANECCLNTCNYLKMIKFCRDKTKARQFTAKSAKHQTTLEQQEEQDQSMQDPDLQLSNSPPETEESEPASNNPLYHLIKFMHRQFVKNGVPTVNMDSEEGQLVDNQQITRHNGFTGREPSLPQARIQPKHTHSSRMLSSTNSEYSRPRGSHQRHLGGSPYSSEITGDTGVSFTNTASSRQGHASRHHRPNAATNNGRLTAPNSFPNQLPIQIPNFFPHHQGTGQQPPRKTSANAFTSTMAPDVTIIRLEPSTDDEAFYGKRK